MATPGTLGSSVLASKTKTKKKHFVAQKVKLFRASDPLLSVLMWGVNHSMKKRKQKYQNSTDQDAGLDSHPPSGRNTQRVHRVHPMDSVAVQWLPSC